MKLHNRCTRSFFPLRNILSLVLLMMAFGSSVSADEPKKLAFIVGVSVYHKEGLDALAYAHKDANDLAAELKKNNFTVTKLIAEEATKKKIEEEFEKFIVQTSQLGRDDIVLISFSGHGLQRNVTQKNERGEPIRVETPFYCPYDTLKSDVETLVSLNWILDQVTQRSGCGNNLVIVDACRNNASKGARTLDGSTVKQLPSKISILFSCRSGQQSWESDKVKQGVFTHALLEGLRGKAQANGNGKVDWVGLAAHVMREVPDARNRLSDDHIQSQSPNLLGNITTNPVLVNVILASYEEVPLDLLKSHAENGIAEAQFYLGRRYDFGNGVTGDDREAVKWYRLAAEQGYASAQNNLGVMYELGDGVTKDLREAVNWYRKAVKQGYAISQFNLGVMYANGHGVAEDDREAVKWYRLAAEQGDVDAQFNLGLMYANGEGVPEDDREAVVWYRKAAEQEYVAAQFNLGLMYANGEGVAEDDREAVVWYRKAAEQEYVAAQFNLGLMYANGEGVPEDDREAVVWYRKAAEQEDADAQFNLGLMYDNGEGVAEDDREAIVWYRKAAEQGYVAAQTNLGLKYANGEGVAEDDREAVRWYRKAAEQGYAIAQTNLGLMYDNGEGVPEDDREAIVWYRKAAEQEYAPAQYNLGVMYDNGEGVAENDREAVRWYRKAAEQGFENAITQLKQMGE